MKSFKNIRLLKGQHRRLDGKCMCLLVFLVSFWNCMQAVKLAQRSQEDEASLITPMMTDNMKRHAASPKTKTLVATQVPGIKFNHFENYLWPSWRRIVEERAARGGPLSEAVLPDLFIACTEDACDKIDHHLCLRLTVTKNDSEDRARWRTLLANREDEMEMRCFFSMVPERENEKYNFLHSLHFLGMEPFISIFDMYDYVLRTDTDAFLFPGLLYLAPDNDGWIGSGYDGAEVTHHFVHYAARKFLPELGEPLRPANATPSMQSTFYISSAKLREFVRVLILATGNLYERAFDRDLCNVELSILQQKLNRDSSSGRVLSKNMCKWPLWHRGISSLYGTRIAADYVLSNFTVTPVLDALATEINMADYPIDRVIQAHLMGVKWVVEHHFPSVDICLAPEVAIGSMQSAIAETKINVPLLNGILLKAMAGIVREGIVLETLHHRTAEAILALFRRKHGCSKLPLLKSKITPDKRAKEGSPITIASESYEAILKTIEWAREKAFMSQRLIKAKEALDEEFENISRRPAMVDSLREFCQGECKWDCMKESDIRKDYDRHPLISQFRLVYNRRMCQQVRNLTSEDRAMLGEWCGQCIWQRGTTCDARENFIAQNYEMHQQLIRLDMMKSAIQCQGKSAPPPSNLTDKEMAMLGEWCGRCIWAQGKTCDSRMAWMVQNYAMHQQLAQLDIVKKFNQCRD